MRILIHALGATRESGGHRLSQLLPELDGLRSGHRFTILVPRSLAPALPAGGATVETVADRLCTGWRRFWFDSWNLPGLLEDGDYDVLVSLTGGGPRSSPVPHVVYQDDARLFQDRPLSWWQRFKRWLKRRLTATVLRRSSLIVTPSEAMADRLRLGCPGLGPKRIAVHHEGFDWEGVQMTLDADVRYQVEQLPGQRLVYPVPSTADKGLEELLEILVELRQQGTDASLILTSDLEGEEGLTARIRELDLQDRVALLGSLPRPALGALFDVADLVVYPSRDEAFAPPLLEALGCETPVCAADTEVHREICGNAALYFPLDDPERAAGVLLRALEPEVQKQLIDAAEQRLQQSDWSWKRYTRELIELCGEAAAEADAQVSE